MVSVGRLGYFTHDDGAEVVVDDYDDDDHHLINPHHRHLKVLQLNLQLFVWFL